MFSHPRYWLAKNNVSALELKRHLDVSYPTAWLLKHKLMQVMFLREEGRQLTGRIEADDSYLGGQRQGGTPGRGSENKIAFVAAVQTTESGQPIYMCLSRRPFTKASLQDFAEKSLAAPATLVTDGLGCFTAICSIDGSTFVRSSNAWHELPVRPRRVRLAPPARLNFLADQVISWTPSRSLIGLFHGV